MELSYVLALPKLQQPVVYEFADGQQNMAAGQRIEQIVEFWVVVARDKNVVPNILPIDSEA